MISIKVVMPKSLKHLDASKYLKAVSNSLNMLAEDILVDFNVTTQTWASRPVFKIKKSDDYERTISTNDSVYFFLNFGTQPHVIAAKNAKSLSFQGKGFKAKTTPRFIGSGQGRKAQGKYLFPVSVNHPGNTARDFDIAISEKWEKRVPEIVQRAINSA